MKKIWLLILWILTLISSFSSADSIDPMNLPKFEHFVNDYSNVFTEKQRLELGMLAKNIETNSGYQIVTVLFPHREGNELFDIAIKAFNENNIWDKERNDGLLLAIATEEKKIRIMVWYGLEWKIPDALAKRKFIWSREKVLWKAAWIFRRSWKPKYRKQHWRTRDL